MDACSLEDCTDGAAGDNAGTGGCRTKQNFAGRVAALNNVSDGTADHGDAEEVLLRFLNTLGNSLGNFLGLSVADTDGAFTVTDDNQSGEGETTSTLHNLGHAVDGDNTLDVLIFVFAPTSVAVLATGATVTAFAVA